MHRFLPPNYYLIPKRRMIPFYIYMSRRAKIFVKLSSLVVQYSKVRTKMCVVVRTTVSISGGRYDLLGCTICNSKSHLETDRKGRSNTVNVHYLFQRFMATMLPIHGNHLEDEGKNTERSRETVPPGSKCKLHLS